MTEAFDLVVLGGGSGGIAAARRAAEYGARVALVESARLGGTCVNVGCVPKKVMWHASQIAEVLENCADYGFDLPQWQHDWARLRARREAFIRRLNGIYQRNLDNSGVTLIRGRGVLRSAHEVAVGGRVLRAERVLIATGGRPRPLSIPGAELALDSDGFFALDHCPRRVAVIGSGYIAVELSGVLQALGAQVDLLVRSHRLLSHFDAMLGESLAEALRHSGVVLHWQCQARGIERRGDACEVALDDGSSMRVDAVIAAVGRAPNTEDCGLQAAGVALDDAGRVVVDEWQQSSAANICALGDVTGQLDLTPVAIAAGRRLADRLYGGQSQRRMDYENVPSVIFSHPPIGSVGLSEEAARERYGDAVKVYQSRFRSLYYGVLDDKIESRMKLVCVGDEQRVAGIHVIGMGADELLQGFAVALRMGATKRDFDDTVAIHPTNAEELVTMR